MTQPAVLGVQLRPYGTVGNETIVGMVPEDTRSVLDVGCGVGENGRLLRKARSIDYLAGVEIVPGVAAQAERAYDVVVVGDIEELDLPFADGRFDCLLLIEILEHLRDPWATLSRLTRLIRPGGHVVASVPNVRHYSIVWGLLRGRWEYRPRGLMDITHLRFFTRASFVELMRGAGLTVLSVGRSGPVRHPLLKAAQWLPFTFRDVLNKGYACVAQKPENVPTG